MYGHFEGLGLSKYQEEGIGEKNPQSSQGEKYKRKGYPFEKGGNPVRGGGASCVFGV